MILFAYDKTFEGLLTAVFDAYDRKTFPDLLLETGAPPPLFYDELITVITEEHKANRVWKGLQKKLSGTALSFLTLTWLSELPESDLLLFRYMRKTIDTPTSIELNFGDPDVLKIAQTGKKVSQERHRLIQFVRFQKTSDGIFLGVTEPLYNVLSLVTAHFKDRFSDQKWILYDLKRRYGYFYNLKQVTEIRFDREVELQICSRLRENLLAQDEKWFQQLWKAYFHSLSISERRNLKLHRQNLPARFWKHLPEKQ